MRNPLLLIVDDVPKNLQVLGNLLRREYSDIAVATNGSQALALAKKALPDIILLDIMMPDIDGMEVCAKLKADPDTQGIPVIFLTAKTQQEDINAGFAAGAVDYVKKPFNAAELLNRVRTHLDLKLRTEELERQNQENRELLHVLCHDLTNPLNSLRMYLDLLGLDPTMSGPELRGDMLKVTDNSLQMIGLVRKLRALEEKPESLPLLAVSVADAVQESSFILGNLYHKKGIVLKADLDDGIAVQVEPVSFVSSVLNNLLSNAAKFSYPGGTVEVTACHPPGATRVEIRITDHGVGMSSELVAQLFDVGRNRSRAGTDGELGTGFGMPLVKKFVELYGGSIQLSSKDVEDHPGASGTEVVLSLSAPGNKG